MYHSRRLQIVLLAAATLILAIAATAWWFGSPQGVRRTGVAIVLLVSTVSCLRRLRRLPSRSPVVLYITLIGLGAALFRERLGPQFPLILTVVVGLVWAGIAIDRRSPRHDRLFEAKRSGSAL
jgi:hypothetical protein